MKKNKMFLVLTGAAVCLFAFRGCTTVQQKQESLFNVCRFVEYLVRGDRVTAGTVMKREAGSRCAGLYQLFLPRFRSLDDKKRYFPVFLENRMKRFPEVREYKRAGLIGESVQGNLKIINSNPAAQEKPLKKDLEELVLRENFDRKRIIRYIMDHKKSMSEKELIEGFAHVRHTMGLTGDMIEVTDNDGELVWKKAERK